MIVIEGVNNMSFEAQLSGDLTDRWSITTGYSYLDGEVERADGSGNDGNETRQTPEQMFSVWNNIQISERLSIGVGATYQDSFFVREDNSVEVPSFTRFDAAAFYRLNDRTRLQLNIENLTDEEYFPDAHNDNISTGRPLNARFTVSMDIRPPALVPSGRPAARHFLARLRCPSPARTMPQRRGDHPPAASIPAALDGSCAARRQARTVRLRAVRRPVPPRRGRTSLRAQARRRAIGRGPYARRVGGAEDRLDPRRMAHSRVRARSLQPVPHSAPPSATRCAAGRSAGATSCCSRENRP